MNTTRTLSNIIKERRTRKAFTNTSSTHFSLKSIEKLLQISMHAPNHRRNQPWRFTIIVKDQLLVFWNKLKSLHPDLPQNKQDKMTALFTDAQVLIITTSLKNPKPLMEKENYAATCCAIQNLLLLCEKKNIASFWSTGSLFLEENFLELLSIKPSEEDFVASLFLGQSDSKPTIPKYDFTDKIRYWSDN